MADPSKPDPTAEDGAKAESGGATPAKKKKSPVDFLKQVVGRSVIVKLNSGVEYRGVLACLDGFMNIALEQVRNTSSLGMRYIPIPIPISISISISG